MAGAYDRLHPGIQRWIRGQASWHGLSPIQELAAAPILDGVDCLIEAPTAGGKTEAVLFPALTRAAGLSGEGVRVLYLAPLRALLNNLEGRGETYAEACGLRAFKWHGDVAHDAKLAVLRTPPHLLMTTPESLEAILLRRSGWIELFRPLATVVVDEAHNFAAGDRGGHLLSLLERLEQSLGRSCQRVALSATVGNPEALSSWLGGSGRPPARWLSAPGEAKPHDLEIEIFRSLDAAGAAAEAASETLRFERLHSLLPGHRSLIFVPSRSGAESLAKRFHDVARRDLGRQLTVRTHHSAVSKFYREEAERLIQVTSEAGVDAVISTSTLELGIDIGQLDRVIQMGVLASPSSLLQRLGRTGRRPGRSRYFRGLCTKGREVVVLSAAVLLALEGRSEALLLPRRAFHLLAHQLITLALQRFGVEPDLAWRTLRSAHCFSGIEREELDELVHHMAAQGYLRFVDGALVVGERAEKELMGAGWRRLFAVFDSAPLYEVYHGKEQVGTLDAGFVEALEPPFYFVLASRRWRADAVDPKAHVVRARPSTDGTAPVWSGFGGPDVPYETAQRAGRLLHEQGVPGFLGDDAKAALAEERRAVQEDGWRPGELVIVAGGSGVVFLRTFAGDRINRTLSRLLQARGVEKATSDYREVTLKPRKGAVGELSERVDMLLAELRSGALAAGSALANELETTQPRWWFSPFARCLPPRLWAASLVERSLDCEGLIRYLRLE